jgi:hypothetical protein
LATEYKQKSKKSKEIKYLHVDFITDNKFTWFLKSCYLLAARAQQKIQK